MKKTLTQEVMRFKKTGHGWKHVSQQIYLYIYEFPGKWTNWDEDRCSDFFLSFLPRVEGLVRRFKPDYSFETYLASALRWYTKTYMENQARQEHYDCWSAQEFQEEAVHRVLEAPGYSFSSAESIHDDSFPFEVDNAGRLSDLTLRRRILFILLLRAADLDDHRIPDLAQLVDVEEEWLYEIVQEARDLVSRNIERRRTLQERRNECWYQLDGARRRAKSACDSEHRAVWEKKARTWKKRYATASDGIRRLNIAPTHKDIGRILKVPTGTVSSGLHFLRKAWDTVNTGSVSNFEPGRISRQPGSEQNIGAESKVPKAAASSANRKLENRIRQRTKKSSNHKNEEH